MWAYGVCGKWVCASMKLQKHKLLLSGAVTMDTPEACNMLFQSLH